jgi:serine/threonine protein kinase
MRREAAMDKRVPLKSGDTVFLSNDTYTIHRLLARGGTSLIYEAQRLYCDQENNPKRCFNKKVLLKELAPLRVKFTRNASGELIFTDADVTTMKKLFENEIDCLAAIQDKNIENNRIPDMDSFGDYNNTAYIAMNHIKGELLSEYISKRRMTTLEIKDIFTQILRVVGFLHSIDDEYCHLDLKPHNFIVDALGSVYLFDFGSSMIEDGKWVNNYTENYSAPEVVFNMLEMVGKRSDIYSLGAILFEMVTGESASMDRFLLCGNTYCDEKYCSEYDYNAILSKMLAEDTGLRYVSVAEVSIALKKLYREKTAPELK